MGDTLLEESSSALWYGVGLIERCGCRPLIGPRLNELDASVVDSSSEAKLAGSLCLEDSALSSDSEVEVLTEPGKGMASIETFWLLLCST
jgi:hypothetical protein